MWNGNRRNTICIIWVIVRVSGTSECIFNHWATSCMYQRKRTKLHSWHRRNNSLFIMALKSLIMEVRCQFIFLYILSLSSYISKIYIYFFLLISLRIFIYLLIYFFCFLFQSQNSSRALQATSRYQNTQHASSHFYASHLHIFYISNDFDFSVLFT